MCGAYSILRGGFFILCCACCTIGGAFFVHMVFVASYAVTFSWGAFFIMYCNLVVIHGAIFLQSLLSLYVVLFSLCAVANSLYAVPSPFLLWVLLPIVRSAFFVILRDLGSHLIETRPTTQRKLGLKAWEKTSLASGKASRRIIFTFCNLQKTIVL